MKIPHEPEDFFMILIVIKFFWDILYIKLHLYDKKLFIHMNLIYYNLYGTEKRHGTFTEEDLRHISRLLQLHSLNRSRVIHQKDVAVRILCNVNNATLIMQYWYAKCDIQIAKNNHSDFWMIYRIVWIQLLKLTTKRRTWFSLLWYLCC